MCNGLYLCSFHSWSLWEFDSNGWEASFAESTLAFNQVIETVKLLVSEVQLIFCENAKIVLHAAVPKCFSCCSISKITLVNIVQRVQLFRLFHPVRRRKSVYTSHHSRSLTRPIIHSMEDYQTDIQALLRDISGNCGDPQRDLSPQPPLLRTRPIICSYKSQPEHSILPNNDYATISEQQMLYDVQASRLLDADSYSALNTNDLDSYGSCLKLDIEKDRLTVA